MRQALHAGGTIDVLTREELHGALRDWMAETVRGARPVRFSAQAVISGGAVTVGGVYTQSTGRTGPRPGFLWNLRRLVLVGVTLATDPTSVYVTDPASADSLVYPALTGTAAATGYKSFSSGEFTLVGNDQVVVASTGAIAATGTVTLLGSALEYPEGLSWKYLG